MASRRARFATRASGEEPPAGSVRRMPNLIRTPRDAAVSDFANGRLDPAMRVCGAAVARGAGMARLRPVRRAGARR